MSLMSHSKNSMRSPSRESCMTARGESWTGSIRSSSRSSGESSLVRDPAVFRQGDDETVYSMMSPADKLSLCDRRAQANADSKEYDASIQDLARCLALTRLVYGDDSLRLAEVHARLAKAYLEFKEWPAQAREHAFRALDLLPHLTLSPSQSEDRVSTLSCVLRLHQTLGASALQLGNLEEAEASFLKTGGILGELQKLGAISQEEKRETEFEICTHLSRVHQRQGRHEEALEQCVRALGLQQEGGEPRKACAVYRDMAAIEQAQGHMDRTIEHLLQARAIASGPEGPGALEGARIAHSLALAYSTATEPHGNDAAVQYFEESVSAYRSILGPQDALTLAVQDDLCRFLLLRGQHERSVEIQRECLALKRVTFGELSAEVAESLQLIGGVEMTQGQMRRAYRSMRKCQEVQMVLYGPQHKKTRSTQRTVDMLSQAPEVCWREKRNGGVKTRPPFCAVVSSPPAPGGRGPASDA